LEAALEILSQVQDAQQQAMTNKLTEQWLACLGLLLRPE
jgi:hypothetical protein